MTTNKKNNSLKNFIKSQIFIDSILTITVFGLMIIIITNPQKYTSGTIRGLKLFFNSVLPGLFPFMFLTKLLTEIGFVFNISKNFNKLSLKVFNTPGISLYAFIMSILSGYPIGSKIIADLYLKGQISELDAKRMSVFCTTSGPIFIIGAVGASMFNDINIGIIIYLSHIFSSILLGIIYGKLTKKKNNAITSEKFPNAISLQKKSNLISECLSQTINSLFIVAAYITIFYLLSDILDSFKIFDTLANGLSPFFKNIGINSDSTKGLFYGLIEVTRGCKTLSITKSTSSIILATGILSFSGLSIIMQSMAFLKIAKIKTHFFILTKSVHFTLSMIICYLLLIII